MAIVNQPADAVPLDYLTTRAKELRRSMLAMARRIGQGYIGQGLGIADLMAALYFFEMRYDPAAPLWPGRDRFILSTGHYSIALWAALAAAGILPAEELPTLRRRRKPARHVDARHDARRRDHRRVARTGARPSRRHGSRVAGSTARARGVLRVLRWRAAGRRDLGGRDGRRAASGSTTWLPWSTATASRRMAEIVIDIEPVAAKMRAFNWSTQEIDGNDMAAVVTALKAARRDEGKPHCIVLRTTPGKGRADARAAR